MEKKTKMVDEIIGKKVYEKENRKSLLIKTKKNAEFWWSVDRFGELPCQLGELYEFDLTMRGQSWQLEGKEKIKKLGEKEEETEIKEIKCTKCGKKKENLEIFVSLSCDKCDKHLNQKTRFFCKECFGKCQNCDEALCQGWIV